jgi:hypothetical protein
MKLELKDGSIIEIPDGFKDANEFIAKFNEISQQVPTLQQQAAMAEKYKAWGDPDTLEARLTAHINSKVAEAEAAAKAQGATKKEVTAVGNEVFDRWAELSPQQQIAFMQEQLGSGLQSRLDQMVADKWKQAETALNGATTGTQQQFDLLARALDAKLANPKLDLTKMWEQMGKLAKATPEELMQMAMRNTTADDDWNAKLSNERAKWEEESKKKADAEKLQVLNSDSFNKTFKREEDRPSLNKPGGEDAMRAKILGDALQKGDIQGNQI